MIAYIVLFGSFALGAIGVWCTQCAEEQVPPESSPIIGSTAGTYNTRDAGHL